MPDREKVIKGLEQCNRCGRNCNACPYYDPEDDGGCHAEELMYDAIELLKAQQETIDELISADKALKLLKEPEAMNVDAFVQWCINSHIMGDATVRGIKYWVGKYKEIKEGR